VRTHCQHPEEFKRIETALEEIKRRLEELWALAQPHVAEEIRDVLRAVPSKRDGA